ncbi:hypothetical protein CEXT_122691 [Caerostris extrusa]|uniref:Secreted protein n=1 Tax=Caerostris extrusa TaxID=172846 RepID=A0AAV4V447_CAEEX|nr:hypothetical protein CEXT_122691 [Caerostris extrusa]
MAGGWEMHVRFVVALLQRLTRAIFQAVPQLLVCPKKYYTNRLSRNNFSINMVTQFYDEFACCLVVGEQNAWTIFMCVCIDKVAPSYLLFGAQILIYDE